MRAIDIPMGTVFGRLTVQGLVGLDGKGQRVYRCLCVCGTTVNVRSYALRKRTRSCGCLISDTARETRKRYEAYVTHGHTRNGQKHPLYSTWKNMKARCLNPNSPVWPGYGGRGIYVCDRWLGRDGFPHFLADMGDKPGPEYTLDRKDNDGPYAPENCRWSTPDEQARNQRKCLLLSAYERDALVALLEKSGQVDLAPVLDQLYQLSGPRRGRR